MITFQRATAYDTATLQGIARRVIRANYTPFLGVDAVAEFIESGMSDTEIESGIENCVTLRLDGRAIGFAVTKDDLIHLLMIDTPYQRTGYGSLLLAHVENMLFKSVARIRLQTFKHNANAVAFYRKNGWCVTDEFVVREMHDVAMVNLCKERHGN